MSVPRDLLRDNPGMGEWAFHGMYEPNHEPNSIDDKDTMAFCVPPLDHYYGLREYGSRGTVEIKRDEWDVVVYEARKALRLLSQGNPNVLSMLWLPVNLYIKTTDAGEYLLTQKDAFVGRHVYKPFAGYEKRKALVERHGYDTKNAAHLIRLLRMGCEFLRDGELNVLRYDAPELLAIKHGEWSLEKIKAEAERLFRRAEDAYDRSTLPASPDRDRVNRICVEVVRLSLEAAR